MELAPDFDEFIEPLTVYGAAISTPARRIGAPIDRCLQLSYLKFT
jgi:hypothetical protein